MLGLKLIQVSKSIYTPMFVLSYASNTISWIESRNNFVQSKHILYSLDVAASSITVGLGGDPMPLDILWAVYVAISTPVSPHWWQSILLLCVSFCY